MLKPHGSYNRRIRRPRPPRLLRLRRLLRCLLRLTLRRSLLILLRLTRNFRFFLRRRCFRTLFLLNRLVFEPVATFLMAFFAFLLAFSSRNFFVILAAFAFNLAATAGVTFLSCNLSCNFLSRLSFSLIRSSLFFSFCILFVFLSPQVQV